MPSESDIIPHPVVRWTKRALRFLGKLAVCGFCLGLVAIAYAELYL